MGCVSSKHAKPVASCHSPNGTVSGSTRILSDTVKVARVKAEHTTLLSRHQTPTLVALSSPADSVLLGAHFNGFFDAVVRAYSQHLHLILRPDDVWLAIAQGVAAHVHVAPNNRYRNRFVDYPPNTKKHIKITVDNYRNDQLDPHGGGGDVSWSSCVQKVVEGVGARAATGVAEALTCDFSTTSFETMTASQIVIMDVFKSMFSYSVKLSCGIPKITLEGTLEDWKHLRKKGQHLKDMGLELESWADQLDPILNEFIRTYEGKINKEFWSKVYSDESFGSGPKSCKGWLIRFFPYDNSGKRVGESIEQSKVPLGKVGVTFRIDGSRRDMCLEAGFLGTQQPTEETIRPVVGWKVVKKDALDNNRHSKT